MAAALGEKKKIKVWGKLKRRVHEKVEYSIINGAL